MMIASTAWTSPDADLLPAAIGGDGGKGDTETNPEELLLATQAGCLTMARAAALQEQQIDPGTIETSAELDLVSHESGGYRIPSMRVEITLSNRDWPQKELDAALERAMDMCPIRNALAGTDIQLKFRD
jgi:osmotically inducible protein OsmC